MIVIGAALVEYYLAERAGHKGIKAARRNTKHGCRSRGARNGAIPRT